MLSHKDPIPFVFICIDYIYIVNLQIDLWAQEILSILMFYNLETERRRMGGGEGKRGWKE